MIRAKKIKIDDEWKLIKMNLSQIMILEEIGLLPKEEIERQENKKERPIVESAIERPTYLVKRKAGRPAGSKNKNKQ